MRRKIKKFIEDEINPSISMHGGMIELIDVANNAVYIRMGGGCQGCGMAGVTLRHGIERMIMDEFPSIEEVIDQTDHNSGNNPYYAPRK
jgi:Fe/S biogenesis protein NfuA